MELMLGIDYSEHVYKTERKESLPCFFSVPINLVIWFLTDLSLWTGLFLFKEAMNRKELNYYLKPVNKTEKNKD